jgi:hypothetical protein
MRNTMLALGAIAGAEAAAGLACSRSLVSAKARVGGRLSGDSEKHGILFAAEPPMWLPALWQPSGSS